MSWSKKIAYALIASVLLSGCATTIPKDVLKLAPESLAQRQLQTRQYETKDEKQNLAACSGVLQDLGFSLDESETKLGVIVGSKDRDATDAGQVAGATALVLLAALGGVRSNALETIDGVQKIRASVVTSVFSEKIKVRVTFQRIVWNKRGDISRLETLDDAKLYEGFFEKLSKSVFLEAQLI